ncbi:MAG: ABC transporter permease [Sphingobacteriales bacterium]|nr:ABC transporter permease [Sphingobacteriales bacterium]
MNFKLLYEISVSLLLARWKQTLVAAIGVTFSITMFIALLSFMTGLNDLLDGLILNRTPHIRLYNELKPNETQPIQSSNTNAGTYHFIQSIKPSNKGLQIQGAGAIIQSLQADPRVLGVAPKIVCQGFYQVGSTDLTGVINGIDVVEENRLFKFRDYVVDGNFLDLKNTPNSIILGKGAAETMLVQVGDMVQITSTKGVKLQLKVVGFFRSGLQDIDKVQSFTSLKTAQKLANEGNNYLSDIQIKLHDILQAPFVSKEYKKLYGVDAIDIQTANSQFETGSKVRTIISFTVGITLLIVAGFGIYNILNMMIYEKMDSIAILKASGFSGKDVKSVFIGIAVSIGIFGGGLGLLAGFGLSSLIDQIPFETASLPTIKTYPINYNINFYIIGGIFSIITTYFAGYFPARKASKIDPVIIIRGK